MKPNKLNQPNTLLYLPSINRFVDNEWYILNSLQRLFGTWQLDKYKKNKKDICMTSKDGTTWTIYYLNVKEDKEVFDLIFWNESYEICMVKEEL